VCVLQREPYSFATVGVAFLQDRSPKGCLHHVSHNMADQARLRFEVAKFCSAPHLCLLWHVYVRCLMS
jgi:hypothetical protein